MYEVYQYFPFLDPVASYLRQRDCVFGYMSPSLILNRIRCILTTPFSLYSYETDKSDAESFRNQNLYTCSMEGDKVMMYMMDIAQSNERKKKLSP